jgi:hypothetical protein
MPENSLKKSQHAVVAVVAVVQTWHKQVAVMQQNWTKH